MLEKRVHDLITPILQDLGLELWSCQLNQQGHHSSLRVFIDRADGTPVSLDDCSKVSRELSAVMDVEDVIKSRYNLEVSSPGMDRTLSTIRHFSRYVGHQVKVKLRVMQSSHRQFTGTIEKVEGNTISFQLEKEVLAVLLSDIQKANLIVNF
jgi:ribosome maturation factor RimP